MPRDTKSDDLAKVFGRNMQPSLDLFEGGPEVADPPLRSASCWRPSELASPTASLPAQLPGGWPLALQPHDPRDRDDPAL